MYLPNHPEVAPPSHQSTDLKGVPSLEKVSLALAAVVAKPGSVAKDWVKALALSVIGMFPAPVWCKHGTSVREFIHLAKQSEVAQYD